MRTSAIAALSLALVTGCSSQDSEPQPAADRAAPTAAVEAPDPAPAPAPVVARADAPPIAEPMRPAAEPAPVPTPMPAPAAEPTPPIAEPAPVVETPPATPQPKATPEPKPEPAAKPTPKPEPKPEPKPAAQPKPKPKPEPVVAEPDVEEGPHDSAQAYFEARERRVQALSKAGAKDAKLRAEVDRLLDYRWLAQSSLGGATKYQERCAPRCDDFEAALAELVRHNYLARVRKAERGQVTYLGEEIRGTVAKVDTKVTYTDARGKKRTLSIDYVMHRSGNGWKVRDIHTDRVGLAKTYRHEFATMLAEGGIDKVIDALEKKVAELKSDA